MCPPCHCSNCAPRTAPWNLNIWLKLMLWLDTPRCCSANMSEGGLCAAPCLCVCLPASRPTDRPSPWPQRHRACSRAHLSEPVIASWLRDIWLKCTATDYYYPFLREQFFSLSGKEGRGGSIKLGKIARRRMNGLPRRKARWKVCYINYTCQ